MPEWLTDWAGWGGLGVTGVWITTVCLILVGLAGCLIPVIPGHLMILLAAVFHWAAFKFWVKGESGIEWWTFTVLAVLLAASQIFEWVSGAAGAKWFGGTKWGAAGAFVGGIAGIFFMPFGLILGPLVGAYAFESIFAKQETRPAVVSGVGSAVGTIVSLIVKIIVGVAMSVWLIVDILWIG